MKMTSTNIYAYTHTANNLTTSFVSSLLRISKLFSV